MHRFIITLFILLNALLATAQNSTIETDFKIQDFGTLENINNIQSRFVIKNNSTKNLYVLRADAKRGVQVRINNKTITPGDTSTLYVYIEPKAAGHLDEDIQLITSADPLPFLLKVKGDIKSIKLNDKTACFYFNQPKKKNTETPIAIKLPEQEQTPHPSPAIAAAIPKSTPDTTTSIKQTTPIVKETLDRNIYKANNITFLIDVSSSMRDTLKLPLMQQAMYTLISDLRDIDNVNIITYCDSATIIQQGIKGDNKTVLTNSVSRLKAKGSTMGATAILFALDVVLKNYLDRGNNQLFLITDGAFKFPDDYYNKWKVKTGEKSIALSIIGLGKDDKAITQLRVMARKRNGSFMRIQNREEAQTLVLEEIKSKAKK